MKKFTKLFTLALFAGSLTACCLFHPHGGPNGQNGGQGGPQQSQQAPQGPHQ